MRPLRDIIDLTTAGTKDMTQEQRNFALTTIFGCRRDARPSSP
jgi:hypothetical protein